jgi:hypothetical protein
VIAENAFKQGRRKSYIQTDPPNQASHLDAPEIERNSVAKATTPDGHTIKVDKTGDIGICYTQKFSDESNMGDVSIKKIDSRNSSNIVSTYSYTPADKMAQEPEKGYNYKVNVSGAHHERYINGVDIVIDKYVNSFRLYTGERVRTVLLKFWVKEVNGFVKKKTETTLFPTEWSDDFIEQKINECTKNVIFTDNKKHRGITKEGYLIEFFTDASGTHIETAYLVP